MNWIDLENKLPTDKDIPDWTPWSQKDWDAWLKKSDVLNAELIALNDAGKIKERNQLIDDNSDHWGELKPWLEKLSYGKCWFFEARNIASHMDVEHFRPKKEAKDLSKSARDGYWWLAFDYMNYRYAGNVPNRKKGGYFPLKKGSLVSTYANQCEESEEYYLLDPTNNYDVNLIAFDESGLAISAPGLSVWDCERVDITIKRLKLNDHPLAVEERQRIWQAMQSEINSYKKALRKVQHGYNPAMRHQLKTSGKNINAMTQRDAELSSVAKWCIRFKGDKHLARLINI